MSRGSGRAAGFTLVELMIVAVLSIPLTLVIVSASQAAVKSFTASERVTRTTGAVLLSLGKIERVLQCGRRATLRTAATDADVESGRAPSVGSWFSMPADEPRTDLEVESLMGDAGLALNPPSRRYRLVFQRDADELPNGTDDDGDGLIDEGQLLLSHDGNPPVRVGTLEACTFEREGQTIRVSFRYARLGHGRRLVRTTVHHVLGVHNP